MGEMRDSLKIGPCFKFCIFIGWLGMMVLYGSAIANGTTSKSECGTGSFTPKKWLAIEGFMGMIFNVSGMVAFIANFVAEKRNGFSICTGWITFWIGAFLVFFNIAGAITVFGHRGYCNQTIYKLSYGIVLGKMIVYPIISFSAMMYGFLQVTFFAFDVASRR